MKLKQFAVDALARVEQCREHQRSLDAITSYLYERRGGGFDERIKTGELRERLYAVELEEWRNVFMWALALDEGTRARIRAAAHERFLADNMAVEHHFSNGVRPGRWMTADEDEFRAMARAAFAPKETP